MADTKPGAEKRHRNPAKVTQPVQARDKLAFLLSLVPYLIDHERVSVSTAARSCARSSPASRLVSGSASSRGGALVQLPSAAKAAGSTAGSPSPSRAENGGSGRRGRPASGRG